MTSQSKKYYRINEVADILELPASTLRWWEREIESFKPHRSPGGTRLYTPEDLETARRIKTLLYERRLSIDATATLLKESMPLNRRPRCRNASEAINLLARLSEFVKDNPKALQMIDSVEKYLKQNLK